MNFISKVAQHILKKEGKHISEALIIVPGKRIGVFLKQALETKMETSTFFPQIIGFQEWVEQSSNFSVPHTIRLQIECYHAYTEICTEEEPDELHQFLKWSSTLINDFNEIDKGLVDADSILKNLKNFSSIDQWSDNLSDLNTSKLAGSHQKFWTMASDLYIKFKENLTIKKWAYNGMLLRDVAENIHQQKKINKPIYIVGFNALSLAEEKIFDYLVTQENAQLLWDVDQDLFNDPSQETGHFLRKYFKKWSEFLPQDFDWKSSFYKSIPKQISISGIQGSINQSEIASHILNKWNNNNFSTENTAVVLCDEKALIPLLNRIPDSIQETNITMGYSIQNTPILSFVQILFELLKMDNDFYYLKSIEQFFNHPFLKFINAQPLIEYCKKERIWRSDYLSWKKLFETYELHDITFIFQHKHNAESILKTGFNILKFIFNTKPETLVLEREFLYTLHQVWHQCIDLYEEYSGYIKHPRVLSNFIESILRAEKLDFIGNPIGGLQIMGMLETRMLDFEHIVFLGINEGVMPKGNVQDSLIPLELRQFYYMTTFLEKDAIYAYHFFRLLQRSKNLQFIYDTNIESTGGANKSRFIQQIEKEWSISNTFPINITNTQYSFNNKPNLSSEVFIKGATEQEKLLSKAMKGISASFINEYFVCPVNFYRTRVLGIKTTNADDKINHAELGTAVHNTLEIIYNKHINKPLTLTILQSYKKMIPTILKKEFQSFGSAQFLNQAQNKIRYKVAYEFVKNMINLDIKTLKREGELIIIENEKECRVKLEVPGIETPIQLTGFIDRIDKINDLYRIVDYKTGNISSVSMTNFYEDILEDRSKDFTKQFQVMFYAYMLWKTGDLEGQNVQSGLISFRNFTKGYQALKNGRKLYSPFEDMERFEGLLIEILQEILLGNKEFSHPEAIKDGCYFC